LLALATCSLPSLDLGASDVVRRSSDEIVRSSDSSDSSPMEIRCLRLAFDLHTRRANLTLGDGMADEDLTLVILRTIQTRLTGMDTRLTGIETRLTGIETRLETIDDTLVGYGGHVASLTNVVVNLSNRLTPAVEDLQRRVSILETR
jgi:hypothetical protein